jgi:hypothetical protein
VRGAEENESLARSELWEAALPGAYPLRSTGEVVVEPDFVAEWTFVEEAYRRKVRDL